MTSRFMPELRIVNYKSIDSLQLHDLSPFTVFAGPNGSGKSNFFDALEFVGLVSRFGVPHALRSHGGFHNIRSAKRYSPRNQRFEFDITCDVPQATQTHLPYAGAWQYQMIIRDLHASPRIEEHLSSDGVDWLVRSKDRPLRVGRGGELDDIHGFSDAHSAFLFVSGTPLARLLNNITTYCIDPRRAKEPDPSDMDPASLLESGSNLATVLARVESDPQLQAVISDWMAMIVPGIERISTQRERIDHSMAILFKERGTKRRFPARQMSDGTMYALCLLVAIIDRHDTFGITLIEEPERGLHPAAIGELVTFLRELARPSSPIWLTTHSESVVRSLRLDELVLVDKVEGRTKMTRADEGNLEQSDLTDLGLDGAWLSNVLNGGLPW